MERKMKILLWVIAFSIAVLAWARYTEKRNIYFPTAEIDSTPTEIGLRYESVSFRTADNVRLHGWFVPCENARFTLIFLHGNGGNISHRLAKVSLFHKLGLNVFIFDYRGYGKSRGTPSEKGLYRDADAAYEYLVAARGIPKKDMILYGESLGGAVAIDLAKREEVRALITEETFTSIPEMSKIVYPFIPSFIISTQFDSVSKIKDVSCPKLIIHSEDDEIVPFYLGKRLFDAAAEPKIFYRTRGAHNTAFFDSEKGLAERLKSFLRSLS